MSEFPMDFGWRVYHPNPTRPAFVPPPGAVDAHCHVFGPGDRFPYAPERKYTPCDAPKEKLWALRDFLGFSRNVIVQATCHGADNRALVDALLHSGGRARGVATVRRDIDDAELQRLHAAGVRGVRFNFVKRLVDKLPFDSLVEIAQKIAPLGWHIVIYFEAEELPELYDFFAALPTPVVVDHMGRPDVRLPVDGGQFQLFAKLMTERDDFWCKVSCPDRLTHESSYRYDDVVPFARHIVERFPDRVLWGTDWPHPNLKSHTPDDGLLVDFIPRIAVTADLQCKLLVDNPMRTYADIPGTGVFDAEQARKGYHLNQFCTSLMKAENRDRFHADERAYLDEWPMTEAQKQAVLDRDYNAMLESGGNIYFLAKIFLSDGQSFEFAASKMTGATPEEYRQMMLDGGRPIEGNRYKGEKGGDL